LQGPLEFLSSPSFLVWLFLCPPSLMFWQSLAKFHCFSSLCLFLVIIAIIHNEEGDSLRLCKWLSEH
jgi:hypothetical protein